MEAMNEKLLDHFNQVESKHWWWAGRRQLLLQLLQDKDTTKILDVGCGTGETLSFLKNAFPKSMLFGVDQSQVAVNYALSRGHEHIYQSDALKLPFKDNTFDAVLLLDVIEHIKRDDLALKEAKRVLKKDGVIVVTSPALNLIWSDHDTNQGHQRRYTRTNLRNLARKTGLDLTYISYFNFFLSFLIIPIRLISRLNFFKHLSSYDSKVNFGICKINLLNKILKSIFINEIKLLRIISYPVGISVGAVFEKA